VIRCKTALVLTLLTCGVFLAFAAAARADALTPAAVAQASSPPTVPAPPSAPTPPSPPSPPAANQSAASATSAADAAPIGSVATLQGGASVAHNHATTSLKLRDAIFKGDVLQTGVDGTLGITFDDDTTFSLSPNSRLTVDDFIYQQGGAGNAGAFNIVRGTVAFVAAEVAKTGDMKIETPTATLGIRGTTGLVEIPQGVTPGTVGPVNVKLYPDANGSVGRINVVGRDGTQLGTLSRGATGFAIRPGATGRFAAVPLQISAEEAARDRAFVQQTFAAQRLGRAINIQRRNLQRRNLQRQPGQPPGRERPPALQRRPGQPLPAGPGAPKPAPRKKQGH
jgi:hypothetical protein